MDDGLMASTGGGWVFTCCGGKERHEAWCNRERTKRQQRGRAEPLTAADVHEINREHDRRLAARLQQAANLIVAKGQKHPDVRPAAFVLRTIAEALETDR